MKTVIKNGGLGIRQYIEKLKGTLCTHIVYGMGVSGILPFSLPPVLKRRKDAKIFDVVSMECTSWEVSTVYFWISYGENAS